MEPQPARFSVAAIVFIFGLRLQPEPQCKAHSINHFHNPYWHADCPWIRASVPDRL